MMSWSGCMPPRTPGLAPAFELVVSMTLTDSISVTESAYTADIRSSLSTFGPITFAGAFSVFILRFLVGESPCGVCPFF